MKKNAERSAGSVASEGWAVIAEQTAHHVKQAYQGRSGYTPLQTFCIAGVLVAGIAYALLTLFLPQAVSFQPPSGKWLRAHPVIDIALAVIVTILWNGVRLWLYYAPQWRSKRD